VRSYFKNIKKRNIFTHLLIFDTMYDRWKSCRVLYSCTEMWPTNADKTEICFYRVAKLLPEQSAKIKFHQSGTVYHY